MFIKNRFIRDSVGRWINLDYVLRLMITVAGDVYHIQAEVLSNGEKECVFIRGPFDSIVDAEDYLDKGMGI